MSGGEEEEEEEVERRRLEKEKSVFVQGWRAESGRW